MPKTTFVDGDPSNNILGTILTAAFLNALNNHRHSGANEDGAGALDYAGFWRFIQCLYFDTAQGALSTCSGYADQVQGQLYQYWRSHNQYQRSRSHNHQKECQRRPCGG